MYVKINGTVISCGVHSIAGLHKNHKLIIRSVKNDFFSEDETWDDKKNRYIFTEKPSCAFYMFSDLSGPESNGSLLAAFIKKNKLGKIVQSSSKKNPNSGNMIRVWIWEVNAKALLKAKL